MRPRYLLWLLQSEADFRSVTALIQTNNFAQACFYAQQAAEKSLKALAMFRGASLIKSHSLAQIARDMKINGQLAQYAFKLDLYYLSARYPDALPEGSLPSEEFSKETAVEAAEMAGEFIAVAKAELKI